MTSLCRDDLVDGTTTATITSDQASLMPTNLDALTTLDLTLIAAVAILSLVSGGLALRLQGDPQSSKTDDKQNLSSRLSELQEQLKAAQAETKDAREEAELTLLQLHQVQEELEHYFLLSREQNALLDGHAHQQKRVQKLLHTVLSAQTHSASTAEAVA